MLPFLAFTLLNQVKASLDDSVEALPVSEIATQANFLFEYLKEVFPDFVYQLNTLCPGIIVSNDPPSLEYEYKTSYFCDDGTEDRWLDISAEKFKNLTAGIQSCANQVMLKVCNQPQEASSNSSMPSWAIALIVLGIVAACFCGIGFVYWYSKREERSSNREDFWPQPYLQSSRPDPYAPSSLDSNPMPEPSAPSMVAGVQSLQSERVEVVVEEPPRYAPSSVFVVEKRPQYTPPTTIVVERSNPFFPPLPAPSLHLPEHHHHQSAHHSHRPSSPPKPHKPVGVRVSASSGSHVTFKPAPKPKPQPKPQHSSGGHHPVGVKSGHRKGRH
jgi:hypothetical protein